MLGWLMLLDEELRACRIHGGRKRRSWRKLMGRGDVLRDGAVRGTVSGRRERAG